MKPRRVTVPMFWSVVAIVGILGLVAVSCAPTTPTTPTAPTTPTSPTTPTTPTTPSQPADKVIKWTMQPTVKSVDPIGPFKGYMYQAAYTHTFRDWIKQASGGRLEIEIVEPDSVFPGNTALEAVGAGFVDMSHSSPGNWSGKMPEMNIIGGLPGGWDTLDGIDTAIYTYGLYEKTRSLYTPFNLTYLPCPQLEIMNVIGNFAMPGPQSMAGQKVRTFGQWADYIQLMGGVPVSLPYADVYTGLKLGTVDGAWTGAQGLITMSFGEVVTDMVVNPNAMTSVFLINNDSLNALPNDIRDLILNQSRYLLAYGAVQLYSHQLYTVAQASADFGIKTWAWNAEDMKWVREQSIATIWPKFAAANPLCGELVDLVEQQFRDFGLLS